MTKRKIEYWVIPPEADAEFVAGMEEVLETYEKAYDPACPVVCMDEKPVMLHQDVRPPQAMLPGRVVAVMESRVRRFIFSSTCAVYGIPVKVPITEGNPRQPVNPYGATKLAFENALEAYGRAYGLKYASFRYFNAAGADESGTIGEKHEPETHLIPLIFDAIRGKRAALEIFGDDYPTPDGTCIRDYIHVNDLAEAHVLGLEYLTKADSAAMNLGTGQGYSVKEFVAKVEQVTQHKVPIHIGPRREGDPAELVADPALAERLLKWKARRSLDEIIRTAWNWAQKAH